MAAATLDPDKTLSWEKRHRPRAAIAALAGALGLLVYYVTAERLRSGGPSISGLESLQRVGQGPVGDLPSLREPYFQYLQDSTGLIIAMGLGGLIGFFGMAWAVGFLAVATRARAPEFKRFLIYVPIVGGVVYGISVMIDRLTLLSLASDFLDGPRTVAEATIEASGMQQFGRWLFTLGSLLLAVGIVIVALNAMRVGLLTKLFGYIGIVAGALLVMVPLPVVQIFWIGGIGFLLLARWPGGDLPAWRTGTAVPWPSAAEVAAARAEHRMGGKAATSQPAEPSEPRTAGGTGRSKRKKRR